MKLYFFPIAPNPTKVRLYLAEKAAAGHAIEVEEALVNLPQGEQKQPDHLSRNPFGKVPVLELDDGTCLIESLPIIEYLEELHPEPPLIGSDARTRAQVRQLERIADIGVLYAGARIVHATNSPLGLPPTPGVAEVYQGFLASALDYLDGQLSDGRAFVAGAKPSIADCSLAAGLQFARFGKVEIDPGYTHVARWDASYRARPTAQSVLTA